MKHPDINSTNHLITVELSSEIYAALLAKIKITGKTESELIIQGLQQVLNETNEHDRFAILEAALEQKLKKYVESLIKDRVLSSELTPSLPQLSPDSDLAHKRTMPTPTIRPLQVGDRVLILEPESPYYMAKLLVIKTSLIRATVDTDTGEKIFLKRDLRFVESTIE
jgi:hypothetical protein